MINFKRSKWRYRNPGGRLFKFSTRMEAEAEMQKHEAMPLEEDSALDLDLDWADSPSSPDDYEEE